jgi:phosphate transport system permease protein
MAIAPRWQTEFKNAFTHRYRLDFIFSIALWISILLLLVVLLTLLFDVAADGLPRLNWEFINSFPSRHPQQAGIKSALVGSVLVLMVLICVGLPIGIASGLFLEEFVEPSAWVKLLEININNLAGVPSIIYGMLGLELFVRLLEPLTGGRSVLAGGLTLSLLVMPIVIVATREALRAVPYTIREAGYAVGARRWEIVAAHVFPIAFPGILTGTILAISRAIGDTASLLAIGALSFVAFLPSMSWDGLQTPFTVLPIQAYNWISRPQEEFRINAAAAILVLLVVLLALNATAIYLRNRFQQTKI